MNQLDDEYSPTVPEPAIGTSATVDDILVIMETLVAGLIDIAPAAERAKQRMHLRKADGTAPDPFDRELLDTWWASASSLATLACRWPDPGLKAQGAHLHHLVARGLVDAAAGCPPVGHWRPGPTISAERP